MISIKKLAIIFVPAILIVSATYVNEFFIEGCWAARGTMNYGMCGLMTGISFFPAIGWIIVSSLFLLFLNFRKQ